MFEQVNIWQALAGLGIFLFGMAQLEEALKEIAGRTFKRFLRKNTNTKLKSILSGTIVTMVLQSSSVVSLMTIAFVGSQIINLENAIGIIMGANLGTTFTGWIVATLGFKVDVESFALPFIAIGGFAMMFLNKNEKLAGYGKFLIGFGFLFLGLSFIKDTFDYITHTFDIQKYANHGPFVFLLLGVGITALIQSSSACMVIILTALNAQVISFESAVGMAIGADLGTTITAILGGLGGSAAKKQTGLSQFYYNLINDAIAFILMHPLIYIIRHVYKIEDNLYALVAFHSTFNFLGILLFYPFIPKFARFLRKVVKDKQSGIAKYINKVSPDEAYEALTSIKKEIFHTMDLAIRFNSKALTIYNAIFNINKSKLFEANNIIADYENIKYLETLILQYYSKVESAKLSTSESEFSTRLIAALRDVVYSAKIIKDIIHDLRQMQNSDNKQILYFLAVLKEKQTEYYKLTYHYFNLLSSENTNFDINDLQLLNKKINDELIDLIIYKKVPFNNPDISVASILNVIHSIYDSNKFLYTSLNELLLTTNTNK